MPSPDDPPVLHGYPLQQPAQHPPGERAPTDHDRTTPVPGWPEDYQSVKALVAEYKKDFSHPGQHIKGYNQAVLWLEAMEREAADDEDKVDYPAVGPSGVPAADLEQMIFTRNEMMRDDRRAIFGLKQQITSLTAQREALLAACEELVNSVDRDDPLGGDTKHLDRAIELAAIAIAKSLPASGQAGR